MEKAPLEWMLEPKMRRHGSRATQVCLAGLGYRSLLPQHVHGEWAKKKVWPHEMNGGAELLLQIKLQNQFNLRPYSTKVFCYTLFDYPKIGSTRLVSTGISSTQLFAVTGLGD